MRVSALMLGFFVGAFLMWKVAMPVATTADAPSNAAPAKQPGLRVVVYDPVTEPRPRADDAPHIPGWRSAEAVPAEPLVSGPAARLRIVGLGRADARGACAVLDGRNLGCLAIVNPSEKDETEVS